MFGLSLAYPLCESNLPFSFSFSFSRTLLSKSNKLVTSLLTLLWSSLLLLVSLIISLSLRIGARHHVYLVSPILVASIMYALYPLSWWPSLCSTCVLCLSDRHHVLLVPYVLVLSIMSILFSLSWCPLSCPPCVPVSVPAIMSTLCPRLVPAIMSTLFPFPCLGARLLVNILYLYWCSPCQVNLVSRTWCSPSWPPYLYVLRLGFHNYVQIMSPILVPAII